MNGHMRFPTHDAGHVYYFEFLLVPCVAHDWVFVYLLRFYDAQW